MTKALVAEDNAAVRLVLETILRDAAFEVTAVADGARAMTQVFADPPDLLVVDIGLPTLNGLLLIGTLKAIKRSARVIAISGMGDSVQTEALSSGADAFLAKPFARDEFQRVLATF